MFFFKIMLKTLHYGSTFAYSTNFGTQKLFQAISKIYPQPYINPLSIISVSKIQKPILAIRFSSLPTESDLTVIR